MQLTHLQLTLIPEAESPFNKFAIFNETPWVITLYTTADCGNYQELIKYTRHRHASCFTIHFNIVLNRR